MYSLGGSQCHLHDVTVTMVADVQVPVSIEGEAPWLVEAVGAIGGSRPSVRDSYPVASNSGDETRGNVDLWNVCNAMHILARWACSDFSMMFVSHFNIALLYCLDGPMMYHGAYTDRGNLLAAL